jgi:hypothetical protein
MKKQVRTILSFIALSFCLNALSQNITSGFEEITLTPSSYYDGSTGGSGFASGSAYFPTTWDTTWSYWAGGWAATNMTDSTTSGFANIYSAKTAGGYNSSNYAIGTQGSVLRLTGLALGDSVQGVYVTNTTYAYNSMRDGDFVARKFGDTTGTNCGCAPGTYPDWFLLTVKKYYGGVLSSDSVYFYLADFRFTNSSNDYILNSWQYINLKSLGMADSLVFNLSSSDNGQFGMNTPAFFAIDNFVTKASIVGIKQVESKTKIVCFPNPAKDQLHLLFPSLPSEKISVRIFDLTGREVMSRGEILSSKMQVDISNLSKGNYLLQLNSASILETIRFVKE